MISFQTPPPMDLTTQKQDHGKRVNGTRKATLPPPAGQDRAGQGGQGLGLMLAELQRKRRGNYSVEDDEKPAELIVGRRLGVVDDVEAVQVGWEMEEEDERATRRKFTKAWKKTKSPRKQRWAEK